MLSGYLSEPISKSGLGAGSYLGSLFSGWIGNVFTDPRTQMTNWTGVFLVPCVLTILCAIVFAILFRESRGALDTVDMNPESTAG